MSTRELYTKGARVWIRHPDRVWEGAEVVQDYKGLTIKVKSEDGAVHDLEVKTDDDLPPLRNPDILIGENDLTSLSYLHEPAVLYNLQVRFCRQSAIYTYCGIVLVAINPYDELPIYGSDTVWAYRGQAMGDLDPHIFAVAEEAYTKLEREENDQSIIVSGESGAGKTVSAKYAMRYFATVGGSSTETQVEKKVLASSPIMEAIGNAKTTRNDNSSRFGKFIEIHFNKQFHIQGASMRTYLLEKSRVVFQAAEERNYHIFYQLCAARDLLPELHLSHQDNFHYLNQGANPTIDGVNDAEAFEETTMALSLLGFSQREQADMFKVLAAILHLGNVTIMDAITEGVGGGGDSEGSAIPANDKHLLLLAELLQLDASEMRSWLCHRKIVSMREVFFKPMTVTEAVGARDALAKHIYAELFNWIVTVVNKSLESTGTSQRFIGVLDIYGFETFDINSFEQFCINYANEKLQQQFNQHVFKLEQEEYLKEEIEWKFIDFYDNQPCIDLIETKLGILDLLDEECRMPKGTDSSWVEKLYSKCTKWKHFSRPRFGTTAFLIYHFADNVTYQSDGFLEKNRDTVLEDQINVVKNGQNKLVRKLFHDELEGRKLKVPAAKVKVTVAKPTVPVSSKQHKKTVGSQFRDSLNMLMTTLNATTPHYVRCIKPNDNKVPFEYNPVRAVQQLRACGVLETIRISAAGFPSRWTYADFFHRYRVLCKYKDIQRNNMRATCEKILGNFIKVDDKYQFGKTKIFFRAGQVAYLEKLRADKLRQCCIIIQKQVRAFICRKKYLRKVKATQCIQRYVRGFIARRRVYHIRRNKAATTIQRHIRGWLKRTQFGRIKLCILGLQARSRGLLARRRYQQMRYNHKAIIIQKYVRCWLAQKKYQHTIHRIITVQSVVRRWMARRLFKKLKQEARSVEHVKKLNKGLENKIISLQQRIEELVKENNILKSTQHELADLRIKVESLKGLEAETKRITIVLNDKERELEAVVRSLEHEQDEKVDLVNEKERIEKERKEELEIMNSENIKLKAELDELNERIKSNQIGAEKFMKTRLEEEKLFLIREHDQDRDAYQKLLTDYNALEQRSEMLEKEIGRLQRGGANASGGKKGHERNLSDASTASVTSELPDDDYGYGSVRSTVSASSFGSHQKLENIDWNQQQGSRSETVSPERQKPSEQTDVALMLKLQQKLKDVEKERNRLQERIECLEKEDSPSDDATRTHDTFKLQELEMENSKLKTDLAALRKVTADGETGGQELLKQLEASQLELDRRREECIQLHSVLSNQTKGLKSVASNNYSSHIDIINEDGELVLAFEAQKKINRQLEDELQAEKTRWQAERNEFMQEIERLKEDNDRQQKLLSVNLMKSPQTQTEAFMQHEITRLTSENLDLQEKFDVLSEQCRKYRKQIKLLAKKLKDAGVTEAVNDGDAVSSPAGILPQDQRSNLPVVRKKERDYLGMFEYRKEDEQIIVRHLIYDLKPRVAVSLLPGLPAYILFMCIRHTDFTNDDEKVRSLLTATINTIKKVIKKRHEDLDTTVLWLSNTLRLLHNLKQYSGDKTFQAENTPKQIEQCLHNFDLSEYRQVLSDIAVWIYQGVIRHLEERVQPMIVPAILEHEAISGLSGQKPGGMRGRASSVVREPESPVDIQKALDTLLQELSSFHRSLGFHGVDPELIVQVFRQLFYFICASSLNNLLLRKDLCHWTKGMQIRYNLSHLEQWIRDQRMQETNVPDTLQPIIQAAQLLQARKTDEDVQSVCDMCDKLSMFQIIKILNLYTPADEFEERVPVSFIRKIQATLQERTESQEQAALLMETKFSFPVRFPFNPSNIRLEDIEIPECLNLPMLKKV
ncbi:unconventional myosin-Va [Zootermopsis nevadensis]|uniref:unconventional myosin-Va n=1 Tax=Zootermopsis nevadensis TaxID=136037 RepID=UPI000B8E2415|nr:unconventional myosin-Va [Zootermopsis nevadensis]